MPDPWRKCRRCIADGTMGCDVSEGFADDATACEGPYKNRKEQTVKRRKAHGDDQANK